MPRTPLAAFVAATLLALLAFAAPVASADVGDIGYQDQSFTGYGSSVPPGPSGTKPESKLWFNDGSWWAVMFDSVSTDFHIFKLNVQAQQWSDTGVAADDRANTLADALWSGSKLYVASHVMQEDGAGTSGNPSRLYRYSYSGGTYTLDSGFPVSINDTSSETLVIDKNPGGKLWATWTQKDNTGQLFVMVNTTDGNDAVWGTPFKLSNNPLPGSTSSPFDDISSLVAFGGNKIGVMWSDQDSVTPANSAMFFAVHVDGAADGTWSAPETAIGGTNMADDHINLKADASGRVFAATKTVLSGTQIVQLLVRKTDGTWVKHPFGDAGGGSGSLTRPIVVLDSTNAHVFMTAPDTGGTIVEKTLPLSQAETDGAAPGLSTDRIKDASALKMNNATSTKQLVSVSTGLVVLATNKQTSPVDIRDYWHSYDTLTPAGPAFSLIPTGPADFSKLKISANGGVTANLFSYIDEGIATPDDGTTYVQNDATIAGGADGNLVVQLTDTPSNFTAMTAVTIDIRARLISRIDDTTVLKAQIFKADGTTPLSGEATVATNPGLSAFATVAGVTLPAIVGGTKTDWDGALLKLSWDWTQGGATPDNGNRLRLTATELHAAYSTGGGGGDVTPPALSTAAVNGSTLTLTYNEALDAASKPANAAFSAKVNGATRSVTNVAIAGSAVTLTLSSAVVAGDTVTVSYAVPGASPLQDVAGNDAVALTDQAVTNNTAGGGGTTATLIPNGDGTRDAAIKTQASATTNLFQAIDDGIATPDDATTYIRNDSGLTGRFFAQLTDTPANFVSITSLTLDARVQTVGRVDDAITLYAQLVKSNGTTTLSNEVPVGTANPGTGGWITISNVALTGLVAGTKADWDGAQLKLRWANVPGGRGADAIQLQLTAVELHAVYSTGGGGGDTTAPLFSSASVNGSTLTMTYNEALDSASTPATSAFAVTVNGAARGVSSVQVTGSTVKLTLASAVVAGNTVTVAYTKPGTNPIQDVAGNDAVNLAATSVTNNTGGGGDVTPPSFVSASVVLTTLTMTYSEALDPASKPAASSFAVTVAGAPRGVSAVTFSGSKVLLTLASSVTVGQVVTVSYTAPGTNPLQDVAGNDAASITNKPVSNTGR